MTAYRYVLLLVFLVIGMIQDLRQRYIGSRLLLVGMLSGILFRFLTDSFSAETVLFLAADICLPVLLLFPLYLIHALGAGDIKICSLISCFLGFSASLSVIYLAFLTGSIWFLISFPKRKPLQKEPFAWTFPSGFLIFILIRHFYPL